MPGYTINHDLSSFSTPVFVFQDLVGVNSNEKTLFTEKKNELNKIKSDNNDHGHDSSIDLPSSIESDSTDESEPLLKITISSLEKKYHGLPHQPPSSILLILPGNPGLPELYINFCESLIEQTTKKGDNILILCPYYLTLNDVNGVSDDISVYKQINYIHNLLAKIRTIYSSTPIDIIGHSFGGWVGLKLLNSNPDIRYFTGISPVINNINETVGAKSVKRWTNPVFMFIIKSFLSIFEIFPSSFRSFFVKFFIKQNKDNVKLLTDKLLNANVAISSLVLANSEFKTIDHVPYLNPSKDVQKVSLFFSSKDRWVPKKHIDHIISSWGDKAYIEILPSEIPHSFIFKYSKVLAKFIVDKVYHKQSN